MVSFGGERDKDTLSEDMLREIGEVLNASLTLGTVAGTEEAAKAYSYNSCRRFLPTAASVFGYTRADAQALGNWVEEEGPTSSRAVPVAMAVHYCDERALASGIQQLGGAHHELAWERPAAVESRGL